MAVSLKGGDFGTILDFFGGLADLKAGVLRVLHNLSFIEDPTRIFRAVRYENRYGFRMDEQTRALARACVDMRLVGDLSSARLRDELIALLGERDVDWSLGRLFELGVAKQVHPKLATGVKTVDLIHRLDALVKELALGADVVVWRLRLAAITRNMSHEELFLWLERLRLREVDTQVIRKSVVLAPRLVDELGVAALSDWDVYRLLIKVPEESLVFALALPAAAHRESAPPGLAEEAATARERVSRFLADLRHRTLSVTGSDIVGLGVRQGPEVGRILHELRRMRVENAISGREQELAAARKRGGGLMTEDLINLVFLLPILLLSMMAHEVAHGWVAFRLGDPTAKLHGRLTANPLQHLDPVGTLMFVVTYLMGSFIFGWAKPVPVNPMFFRNRQRGMAIVGLAGPVTNFLIAVVLALFLNFLPISLLLSPQPAS